MHVQFPFQDGMNPEIANQRHNSFTIWLTEWSVNKHTLQSACNLYENQQFMESQWLRFRPDGTATFFLPVPSTLRRSS